MTEEQRLKRRARQKERRAQHKVSILDNEVKLAEATDVKDKVENTMTIAEQTLELSRQILKAQQAALEQIKRLADTDRRRFPSMEEIYGE